MNYDQNGCQQFYFLTPRFSDTFKHTKNKSWRRCRLYFRGRMQCWWIFDFETNYSPFFNQRTTTPQFTPKIELTTLYTFDIG
jgi:hypothetical protein